MTLGPLQDRVWLHVGARPPDHVERLARLAGGVVLQAPLSGSRARELARSGLGGVPLMVEKHPDAGSR